MGSAFDDCATNTHDAASSRTDYQDGWTEPDSADASITVHWRDSSDDDGFDRVPKSICRDGIVEYCSDECHESGSGG
jgi:hypothetical protein